MYFLRRGWHGELFTDLEQILHKERFNSSYVPDEKLNQFTQKNHQGVVAQIAPISFYPLEELVTKVLETGKTSLFLGFGHLCGKCDFGCIIRTVESESASGINIQKKDGIPHQW